MTDLSEAAEILKRAKMQQEAQQTKAVQKPVTITGVSAPTQPAFYSMTAPSGKVVKMTGDDIDMNPGATTISE